MSIVFWLIFLTTMRFVVCALKQYSRLYVLRVLRVHFLGRCFNNFYVSLCGKNVSLRYISRCHTFCSSKRQINVLQLVKNSNVIFEKYIHGGIFFLNLMSALDIRSEFLLRSSKFLKSPVSGGGRLLYTWRSTSVRQVKTNFQVFTHTGHWKVLEF